MNRLFFKNNKLNFILTLFTLTLDSAAYVGIAFFMKTLMDVTGNRDLQGLIRLLVVIAILLPTYVGGNLFKAVREKPLSGTGGTSIQRSLF